ncbi:MAG: hypothetical protein ACYDCC_14265 [Actinomycetota bacterium]
MKARLIVGALAAALVTGALTWKLDAAKPHSDFAAGIARSACADGTRFISLVDRNAGITEVKSVLGGATAKAAKAATLDPRWIPLQSAFETLELSLDHDDAGTANVGMRVLRAQCKVFK